MLLEHFGLDEDPFGVTPDPRFLYPGPAHREALASLAYGTESNRGFIALIARPGMGKTSLLYQYLETLRHKARTAFLFQTDCHRRELLRHILADLGQDATGKDLPAMHEMFNSLLAEERRAGRRVVLVIDEAQNLEPKALESIRLLSNFETPWMKLLQIIIAGQPQLATRLSMPSLAQLRQRISMIVRLEPLTHEEVFEYIRHRLRVAGYNGACPFTTGALATIASRSEGIPRNINNICFNAMSLACALKRNTINRDVVAEVLDDLNFESLKNAPAAPQPKPTQQQATLTVHRALRRTNSFRSWLPKLAAVSALLFAVSGPLNRSSSREFLPLRGRSSLFSSGAVRVGGDSTTGAVNRLPQVDRRKSTPGTGARTLVRQESADLPRTKINTLQRARPKSMTSGKTSDPTIVAYSGTHGDASFGERLAPTRGLFDSYGLQRDQALFTESTGSTRIEKPVLAFPDSKVTRGYFKTPFCLSELPCFERAGFGSDGSSTNLPEKQ